MFQFSVTQVGTQPCCPRGWGREPSHPASHTANRNQVGLEKRPRSARPRPSSLYGLMAAQPPGVAQRQPRKHGGEGLSGEKVLEKSLIIAGSAQPVSFFSSLADCSHYAMRPWAGPGSCYRDSNPGQRGGHVSSGHPRVHMPWSDEGHAQTHRLTQCGFSINKARSWRDRWGQASGLTVLHPPGLRLRHLPCSSLVLLTMDHYPGLWVGGRGAGERSRRPAWVRTALAAMGQLLPSVWPLHPLETNK